MSDAHTKQPLPKTVRALIIILSIGVVGLFFAFVFHGTPWLAFTGITHAQSLTPPDSIPRLTTGRFTPQNGRLTMPLSVQVHHALMDGRHVAEYFARVQTLLDDPGLLGPDLA